MWRKNINVWLMSLFCLTLNQFIVGAKRRVARSLRRLAALRRPRSTPSSYLLAPEGLTLNPVTSNSSLISSPPRPQPLILGQIFSYPFNG